MSAFICFILAEKRPFRCYILWPNYTALLRSSQYRRASSPPAGLKTSRPLLGRCTASTPSRPGCARLDTYGHRSPASLPAPVTPHHLVQYASSPVGGQIETA